MLIWPSLVPQDTWALARPDPDRHRARLPRRLRAGLPDCSRASSRRWRCRGALARPAPRRLLACRGWTPTPAAAERVPAARRRGAIELHAGGFRHPRSVRFGGEAFTPYADGHPRRVGPGGAAARHARAAASGSARSTSRRPARADARRARCCERIARCPAAPRSSSAWRASTRSRRAPRARRRAAPSLRLRGRVRASSSRPPSASATASSARSSCALGEPWRIVTANFLHAAAAATSR